MVKKSRELILVLDNVRSIHNVGSIFRTAEALGASKLILGGITPFPSIKNDIRLPHIKTRIDKAINKTALGSQFNIDYEYIENVISILKKYRSQDYQIVSLEQASNSIDLSNFKPSSKLVMVVGNEISGVSLEIMKFVDQIIEIQLPGKKESLNVAQACAIAIYQVLS